MFCAEREATAVKHVVEKLFGGPEGFCARLGCRDDKNGRKKLSDWRPLSHLMTLDEEEAEEEEEECPSVTAEHYGREVLCRLEQAASLTAAEQHGSPDADVAMTEDSKTSVELRQCVCKMLRAVVALLRMAEEEEEEEVVWLRYASLGVIWCLMEQQMCQRQPEKPQKKRARQEPLRMFSSWQDVLATCEAALPRASASSRKPPPEQQQSDRQQQQQSDRQQQQEQQEQSDRHQSDRQQDEDLLVKPYSVVGGHSVDGGRLWLVNSWGLVLQILGCGGAAQKKKMVVVLLRLDRSGAYQHMPCGTEWWYEGRGKHTCAESMLQWHNRDGYVCPPPSHGIRNVLENTSFLRALPIDGSGVLTDKSVAECMRTARLQEEEEEEEEEEADEAEEEAEEADEAEEEEADEADEEAESTLLLVDEVLKWTSLKGGGLNVVVLLQERCSCNDNTGENHWAPLAETGYGKEATLALMEHLSRYFEIRAWGYGQVL